MCSPINAIIFTDPRNRSKLFIDASVVQGGTDVSPFVEALMMIRGTHWDESVKESSFKSDMLIRAIFHQTSVQDPEKELVRDRLYRIYDPHILYDFHSRDSSLTLIGDTEVPTVICTHLLEVLNEN